MDFGRYDRIVDYYASQWPLLFPGYLPILDTMRDVLVASQLRPRSIIDVGCGPGSATMRLLPACAGDVRVTLVDGSAHMLELAQTALGARVNKAVQGDFTRELFATAVFPPETYDLVLCSFALHHIDDQNKRKTIERLGASLTRGGLLFLADELASDKPGGWDVVGQLRALKMRQLIQDQRLDPTFWQIETSMPPHMHLPFLPTRSEDYTSFMARAGLAVATPLNILGSALFVGKKT